jgi:uroporphyrinogen decarboxylase
MKPMERLTSPQRVQRVLQGGLPDRVPVLMQNFQNTAFLAGMTLGEYCLNGERMAQAQVAAWERFGYDFIDIENGTAAMAEAVGCQVEYPVLEPPRVLRPALNSLQSVDLLAQVDPTRHAHLPELLKAVRLTRQRVGGRACIVGQADQGPFSLAGLVVGMEDWLMALLDPELEGACVRLLEYCYQQVLSFCLAQASAGADFVEIGDSLAGPDVCSPRLYRKFAFPFERRLAQELNRKNIPLILHICGNATPIIRDMAATGAALLEIDYKVDGPQCRLATQESVVLVGDVDPSGVMALGTPEDVQKASRKAILTYGAQGRFVLSPGCSLPYNSPPENTIAMVEAAYMYGNYPAFSS